MASNVADFCIGSHIVCRCILIFIVVLINPLDRRQIQAATLVSSNAMSATDNGAVAARFVAADNTGVLADKGCAIISGSSRCTISNASSSGGSGSSSGSNSTNGISGKTSSKSSMPAWRTEFGPCSVTCGEGFELAVIHCYDVALNRRVAEHHCRHLAAKPTPNTRPCTRSSCSGARWVTSDWSACTMFCGGGRQTRQVLCVDNSTTDAATSTNAVSNSSCAPTVRPRDTRSCNTQPCPSAIWLTGNWSQCITTCGSGSAYQLRTVTCSDDAINNCAKSEKPVSWRACPISAVTSPCFSAADKQQQLQPESPVLQFEPSPPTNANSDDDLQGQVDDLFDGGSGESHQPQLPSSLGLRGTSAEESKELSSTPSFIASSWSSCSATCGHNAIRTRRVVCRVLLTSVQDLTDDSCAGEKPHEMEHCALPDCTEALSAEIYSWSMTGYGPCSKSCAGGTQDPVFACVRKSDFSTVKTELCSRTAPPAIERRQCNKQPCPAKWRAYPSGPCSAPCGGGHLRLLVQCIQEASSISGSAAATSLFDDNVVADQFCNASTAPARSMLCNLAPCPPAWSIDSWSQCSTTCGDGIQTRQVRCEQKVSPYNIATVDESFCRGVPSPDQQQQQLTKPETERPCNLGDCPLPETNGDPSVESSIRRYILVDPSDFTQLIPRERVSLDVGGTALLIPPSTINIFCPTKGFNRSRIVWKRTPSLADSENVTASTIGRKGRVKVSGLGSMRIRKSRHADAGLYTCEAGSDSASVVVEFHHDFEAAKLQYSLPSTEYQENDDSSDDDGPQHDGTTPVDPHHARRLLNGPQHDTVPLEYVPGPWSECSRTCGGAGLQTRQIRCEVRGSREYQLIVDDLHCERRGLLKPEDSRDCGSVICPHWEAGSWSECSADECISVGVGSRHRPVHCMSVSGEFLESSNCAPEYKPDIVEPCPHSGCATNWVASNWSKCSVSCGGRGLRIRDLQCVWIMSKLSTESRHCEHLPNRPPSAKPCYALPCVESGCRDETKYCSLVPAMNMCRLPQYRRECCHSCSGNQQSTSALSQRSTVVRQLE